MNILDGKTLSKKILADLKDQVASFQMKPGLAVVLVGDDPASAVYVKNKHRQCEEAGIFSKVIRLPAQISKAELVKTIRELNGDSAIHGILVQLPLPAHLPTEEILSEISEKKDVDGFHWVNAGKLFRGVDGFVPCTPKGVIRILDEYKLPIEGKDAVVIGRSNVVGKPMAMLLLERNATVTICHGKSQNVQEYCSKADLVITAVGKAGLVRKEWIKKGAVVVDVGINRGPDGKLTGDVRFDEVSEKAEYITPVPGGVGPMTIAMLLENTVRAFLQKQ